MAVSVAASHEMASVMFVPSADVAAMGANTLWISNSVQRTGGDPLKLPLCGCTSNDMAFETMVSSILYSDVNTNRRQPSREDTDGGVGGTPSAFSSRFMVGTPH